VKERSKEVTERLRDVETKRLRDEVTESGRSCEWEKGRKSLFKKVLLLEEKMSEGQMRWQVGT